MGGVVLSPQRWVENTVHAFHVLYKYFHLSLKQWQLGSCGLVSLERREGKDAGRVLGTWSGDQALSLSSFVWCP